MTFEIAVVLGLLVLAMGLFASEAFPIDITALGLIAALIATGILSPAEAFEGFGNEVIIILAAVMIMAGAVVKAGVMEWLGQAVDRMGRSQERRSILTLLLVSAGSSAFLSNTNTTAILMPAAIETARRVKVSASRILMPLAFASMLGGSGTLIGTSANLAGSGMVARLGFEPFSLFEFIGIGAIVSIAGLLWLVFPGSALIPEGRPVEEEKGDEARGFIATLCLPDGSAAIGKALSEIDFDDLDTDVLAVVRDGERLGPHHSRKLAAGDELLVRATQGGVLKLKKSAEFTLEADLHLSERHPGKIEPVVVEAVITPQSRFVGQSLRQIGFSEQIRGVVLAVYRRGRSRAARIENLQLRAGDLLLLQGPEQEIASMRGNADLQVLSRVDRAVLTRGEGLRTLGAMTLAMVLSAAGLLPLSLALLLAVIFVVVAGNITMTEAYRFIEWRLLVLIAAMSGFGVAMEDSGAAAYLAEHMVRLSAPFGTLGALVGFSLLTVLLTQPMSNAAAVLTMIPVAVAAADGLEVDPRMLAILVTLSASLSFISPLEPACLLVFDAGKYTFFDFVRAGTPLTLICVAVLVVLVPVIW
ncbi:MAG: SLC13 family permease [Proteobacteria bacterium]|nr:SLC13 family permease [Pseudomonadota bacterium]